ncbi:hypothetical protein EVJ58_g10220 [Rhodofomes roseus]|uniref:Uncharacterized protein n=1 Tax=Rhodofomes roseus TaxID=34475 RepID=A0A4Y9XPN1_9APHY|nr:hypothetical protein EVJ58_g10220 [Rhodofomes roseus]
MDSDEFIGDVSALYNDTVDLQDAGEIYYGLLVFTVAPKDVLRCDGVDCVHDD